MVDEGEEYTSFSGIRTVATFDDALHHQRKEEDYSSPNSVLVEVQQDLKRNHSDSNLLQLAASANKGSPWKCNLCFYKNANITKPMCAMCGTHKDNSFMQALDALDNLGEGPNKNEQQEQVLHDNEVSFLTAEDDTTASFQTAKQSQGDNTLGAIDASPIRARAADASPIRARATAEATDTTTTTTTAKQDECALECFRFTAQKLSQKLIDLSVDSSITCNSSLNHSQVPNKNDSIRVLLNTTQTNDEDFDPILFTATQSEDMSEDDMQQHDYGSPPSESVLVPMGDADHQFSFDQEFQPENNVGHEEKEQQQQWKTTSARNKCFRNTQPQEDVDSQNLVFEKEESTAPRNVWVLRGGIVSFVFLVILVSALSIG
jgi:hypothetical protein